MRFSFALLAVSFFFPSWASAQPARAVDFNRDVRPILSDACFTCHGPDKAQRKARLRLDNEDGARADLGGYAAIVAGKPKDSVLLHRITSQDPKKRMPPPAAAPALKPEQVDILTRWIEQGATWQPHWSFIPPERPPLPTVKDKSWPRSGLDYFVLARLEKEGLQPAPEADPITLLRRISLDLTGLPPTPEEVDAFVKSTSRNPQSALDEAVDRLLASTRFGERLASRWLDAARYADTNGYQTDGDRVMWRWRDWVIEAFNRNLPFDQFTIEQIAGDLLPGATLEQKIATGFNRNHRANSEGGVIPEEYAVEYVVDRVDTTATVWLGLTMGCARCHDHKYDPLAMKDFYQLFAFFNNVPERGKAIKYGNSPPYIKTPTRAQDVQWERLKAQLRSTRRILDSLEPTIAREQAAWESKLAPAEDWIFHRGLKTTLTLNARPFILRSGGSVVGRQADEHYFEEKLKPHGNVRMTAGKWVEGVALDGASYLDAGDVGDFGFFDRFTLSAWIKLPGKPKSTPGGPLFSRMADADRAEGYNVTIDNGKVHVHLIKRWLDDAIRVETVEAIPAAVWQHLTVTYDGSRLAAGVKVYLNGQPLKIKVNLDDLNQSFATKEPFRIGKGGSRYFHGAIDHIQIFQRALSAEEAAVLAVPEALSAIAEGPAQRRPPAHNAKLRWAYLDRFAPQEHKDLYHRVLEAEDELAAFEDALPTTMIMEEMPTPRSTHMLLRGEYDKPGSQVGPAIPAIFSGKRAKLEHPSPLGGEGPGVRGLRTESKNPTRLDLARWLVDRSNPLTARVAVNRFWQMLFGAGLIKTVEDFGSQGDWPMHPELLDWLAVEFMEPSEPRASASGWDIKRLLKTIVTSAAYRQSSKASKDLVQRDPDNRLLARGPRGRLPAEIIRDQALFAGGLLTERLGGPSVRPYQPAGLVKELHGVEDYPQDHGPNLYRRSLYTFWKRTVAPPSLMTFDAANRETCVVREARTNTPLQALNLLNDVTYVEAARMLAQRALREQGSVDERLTRMFRLAACRAPRPLELEILRAGLKQHQGRFLKDPQAAHSLAATGESPRDESLDVIEHAAYTAVANLILNLDEVISKE